MSSVLLSKQAAAFVQPRPDIRPGFTVRVHERVQEGGKERIQMFEGLVISIHRGHVPTDTTFTVRRIVSGVGVEKIFSLYAPTVAKVEVKRVAKVRRAKLFFLRGRRGKSARLSERFTTSGEFGVAAQAVQAKEEQEEQVMKVAQKKEEKEEKKE